MIESHPLSPRLQQFIGLLLRIVMQNHYRFVKQNGLTLPQMMILYHIQRVGACTVSDVGEEFGISSAAASQMLDRLVQQGFLTRQEHPQDRRVKQNSLTEAGKQIIEASMNAHQSLVAEWVKRIDANTQWQLLPLLDRLIEILQGWFNSSAFCDE
ncbi:MAG: Transcriptional regulator, MarR family [Anaerolineae bacterium]|nr:MAG: Transcriptional regulator, MarR family [Anaerolineae bacterium]